MRSLRGLSSSALTPAAAPGMRRGWQHPATIRFRFLSCASLYRDHVSRYGGGLLIYPSNQVIGDRGHSDAILCADEPQARASTRPAPSLSILHTPSAIASSSIAVGDCFSLFCAVCAVVFNFACQSRPTREPHEAAATRNTIATRFP